VSAFDGASLVLLRMMMLRAFEKKHVCRSLAMDREQLFWGLMPMSDVNVVVSVNTDTNVYSAKPYTVYRCRSHFRKARPLVRQRCAPPRCIRAQMERTSEAFLGRCKFKILGDTTGT